MLYDGLEAAKGHTDCYADDTEHEKIRRSFQYHEHRDIPAGKMFD